MQVAGSCNSIVDAAALSHSANFRATFVGADDEVRSRLADTRSYRLMSEPIPLRGVHLQAMLRPWRGERRRPLHFAPHKNGRALERVHADTGHPQRCDRK